MSSDPRSAEQFIQGLAREAGALVLKKFGKEGVQYTKSEHRGDGVTKADLLSEKLIISRIKKVYPDHGIIAEESGRDREDAEYVWIIDPIDGTLNFSLGVPMFGVMICLMHRKEIILSAIYLPTRNELFFAKTGKGAYLNGKRIHCAAQMSLRTSVGAGPVRLGRRMANFLSHYITVMRKEEGMMPSSLGAMSVNCCYVACGRRDWLVAIFGRRSDHDFAPVYLIMKEAGCKVTDTKGDPWQFGMLEMVAANPKLHKQLLKLTKSI